MDGCRFRRWDTRSEMTVPLTILVAGDDLLFATRIEEALTQRGHRPRVVRTTSAFQNALRERPDAAIVNLASEMDAIEAIRRAKADAATRTIPVLGFCGHADAARRRAAQEAGCDRVATNGEISSNLPRLLEMLVDRVQAPENNTA
jgi:CheY-like chemotaxis protein